jgi:7,8-dihydropterin-6-yl-methyl-4-(beta-D-ribofuranosyl)aminobenzene 5'-phosphate synthase
MMKIVTLIENQTENELVCEHGLSFYIEFNRKKYLLDAGQSSLFAENAKMLGVDLSDVDMAVLSHAHYDHANGFAKFAEVNGRARIYMQSAAKNKCFSEKAAGLADIGISEKVRTAVEDRVCYADGDAKIDEGVYLVAHHAEGLSERGKQMHMFTEVQGEKQYDDFAHEQSLVFELPEGIIVFNSCCHGGVDLVLEEAKERFKDKPVIAMLGGFHLMGSDGPDSMRESEEQVRLLGQKLCSLQVGRLYTGHCTGTKAFPILKEVLGDRLQLLVTGKVIEL